MSGTLSAIQTEAEQDAEAAGIPVSGFLNRIANESSWNPMAVNSTSGAAGLGGVLASTGADPGYGVAPISNVYDPAQNLSFSASLLAAYIKATGSVQAGYAKFTGQPVSNFNADGSQVSGNNTSATQTALAYQASGYLDPSDPKNIFTGDPLGQGMTKAGGGSSNVSLTGSSGNTLTSWSGWLGDYFTRGVIVIVGMIILAGGLFLLSSSNSLPQTLAKLPRLPIPE